MIRFVLSVLLALCAGVVDWRSAAAGEIEVRFGQVYSEPQSGPQSGPLKADVYMPRGKGPFPGVSVVHGGAWYIGMRAQLSGVAQLLAHHGFTPAAFVTRDDPPLFSFHGDKDHLVPLASPESMCRDLRKAGVEAELYVVPDMGHAFAAMDRTALEKSAAFLSDHLQREETP